MSGSQSQFPATLTLRILSCEPEQMNWRQRMTTIKWLW